MLESFRGRYKQLSILQAIDSLWIGNCSRIIQYSLCSRDHKPAKDIFVKTLKRLFLQHKYINIVMTCVNVVCGLIAFVALLSDHRHHFHNYLTLKFQWFFSSIDLRLQADTGYDKSTHLPRTGFANPASFCLFSSFSCHNSINQWRCCAWDSNPGLKDGGHRWIHWAMTGANLDQVNEPKVRY